MTDEEQWQAYVAGLATLAAIVAFVYALAYRGTVEDALEQVGEAVVRFVTWPVRRWRSRRNDAYTVSVTWASEHARVRADQEQFNRAATTVVALNERQDSMATRIDRDVTTGAVTRTHEETALSWGVGDTRFAGAPRQTVEWGTTHPTTLDVRVMIPRSPSEAEQEAERYGMVSAGLTLDEAESFALGLLSAVATARFEQRTAAVSDGEPAL